MSEKGIRRITFVVLGQVSYLFVLLFNVSVNREERRSVNITILFLGRLIYRRLSNNARTQYKWTARRTLTEIQRYVVLASV